MSRKNPPVPGTVHALVHTWQYRCLAAALVLTGLLSLLRVGQRILWLTQDFTFQPLIPYEKEFVILHEASIALPALLSLLMGLAGLLMFTRLTGGLRLMKLCQRLCAAAMLLGALAALALTALVLYVCSHYRLSVTLSGWALIIGVMCALAFIIGWRYHHNVCRILTDLQRTLSKGGFLGAHRGVRCHLQSQAWLMAVTALLPIAALVLGTALYTWLVSQLLQPIIGPVLARQLLESLTTQSATGAAAMAILECVLSAFNCLCLALSALLYRGYMRAHHEEVPHYWKPHTHGAGQHRPSA